MKHTTSLYYFNPHTMKVWADTNQLPEYRGNDVVLAEVKDNDVSHEEALGNGMRIAQCLNACRGMENPVDEIERLRHIEKMMVERKEAGNEEHS